MVDNKKNLNNVLNELKGENIIGCEVGVLQSRNALTLFKKFESRLQLLYLVDSWPVHWIEKIKGVCRDVESAKISRDIAYDVLKPYADRCKWLEMLSVKAAIHIPNNSLDFVYIDADHSYEGVLVDLLAYWPKVKSHGLLVGHDWAPGTGVEKAVREFCRTACISETDIIRSQSDTHWWIWKKQ